MTIELTPIRLSDPEIESENVLLVGAGLGTGVTGLWKPITQYLPNTHVIGWDLPGHDHAPAHDEELSIADLSDAVAELVAKLRNTGELTAEAKLFYAGVSVNGEVALQLALDHSELFDGIAVICSAAKIGELTAWRERAELVAQAGTPTQMVGSAQRWFAEGFIESHPTDSTNLLHVLQNADRFSYARICEALANFDVREQLGKISVPIISIQGADDAVCSVEDGEFIASSVQNGQAFAIDKVAHQAPVENPERVAEILSTTFLGKD